VNRESEAPRLHALAAKDQRRIAGGQVGQHRAQKGHRDDDEQRVACRKIRERAGRGERRRQLGVGQEKRVTMFGIDRRDHLFLARPEAHRRALGGQQLRERGAPGAAADHPETMI
jgi:hypothetical protein